MEPQQITPAVPAQPVPVEQPRSNRNLKILLLVFLFLLLGTVIVYAYQGYQSQQVKLPPPPAPPIRLTSTIDETSEWKTYRNDEYGFEFQYPFAWEIVEAKPKSENNLTYENEILNTEENEIQKVTFSEKNPKLYQGHFQIRVLTNPKNHTLDQWAKNYNKPLLADLSTNLARVVGDTTIDNIPAKEISINTLTVPSETVIVALHNKYIYFLNYDNWKDLDVNTKEQYDSERLQEINDQILSTFRFMEEEATPAMKSKIPLIPLLATSGWRTVSQNGVSFKIPPQAICNKYATSENKDNNCKAIFWDEETIIPLEVEVEEYLEGSRRDQYLKTSPTNDCNWLFKEAYFGKINALQIAGDGGLCYGAGAIVTVAGDKLVIVRSLSYDLETKEISRVPLRDTVISTLESL